MGRSDYENDQRYAGRIGSTIFFLVLLGLVALAFRGLNDLDERVDVLEAQHPEIAEEVEP